MVGNLIKDDGIGLVELVIGVYQGIGLVSVRSK